jgi:peptidoglycan/xylan/chitin deacetylase (PgdA/CDA1 family)
MVNKIPIALSFDDGYLSQYSAAKVLHSLGIRATFYLITGLKRFEAKTLMSAFPDLVLDLISQGHEIGSHTSTHPDLTTLSVERLMYELISSKKYLENITGTEILGFAYPYGTLNGKVLSAVKEHYFYARSAGLYKEEDRYNFCPPNLYLLSTVGFKKLAQMLTKMVICPHIKAHPILVYHNVSLSTLILQVNFLKRIPGIKFVRVSDIAQSIVRELK